jgi:hypothetical protein
VAREQHDFSVRIDPKLHAGRCRDGVLQELLDDAAALVEFLQVTGRRFGRDGAGEMAQLGADGLATLGLRIPEEGVALAREALFELQHGFPDAGSPPSKAFERPDRIVFGLQVFEAFGERDAGLAEDLAASGLRAEPGERRIHAVQGNPEQDGQAPLERRRVEAGHERAGSVGDSVADPLDQARPLEDLFRQRARRGVVGAEQRQARARMARRDSGEKLKVVLEDERMDGLRGDVDHPSVRVAKPNQQEQESFFVVARGIELGQLGLVERQRRDHHRGVGLFFARRESVPEILESRLQSLELGNLGFEREVPGEGRLGNHDPEPRKRTRARPDAPASSGGQPDAGSRRPSSRAAPRECSIRGARWRGAAGPAPGT